MNRRSFIGGVIAAGVGAALPVANQPFASPEPTKITLPHDVVIDTLSIGKYGACDFCYKGQAYHIRGKFMSFDMSNGEIVIETEPA